MNDKRKAAAMTREEALAALKEVGDEMSAQHAGQPDRLHQLASALGTARMAVDHLFDHDEYVLKART